MALLRATIARFPGFAVAFLALALLMKVWVPAGYMPVTTMGRLALAPCSGTGPMVPAHAMHGMQQTDMPHDISDTSASHSNMPCTFSGLAAPILPGADPLLILAALAFIFMAALHFRPCIPRSRPFHLRPPAQAPPANR